MVFLIFVLSVHKYKESKGNFFLNCYKLGNCVMSLASSIFMKNQHLVARVVHILNNYILINKLCTSYNCCQCFNERSMSDIHQYVGSHWTLPGHGVNQLLFSFFHCSKWSAVGLNLTERDILNVSY